MMNYNEIKAVVESARENAIQDYNSNYGDKPFKEMVFMSITTQNKCYENYKEVPQNIREKEFGRVLVLNKFNGLCGFAGGNHDQPTLTETLIKENKEEMGFNIVDNIPNLRLLKTFVLEKAENKPNYLIYHFTTHMDYDSVLAIMKDIPNAEHFDSEITGYTLHQIGSFNKSLFTVEKDGNGEKVLTPTSTGLGHGTAEEELHLLVNESIERVEMV